MSAASHQPATTTHNPTGVPPVPPATRQDAVVGEYVVVINSREYGRVESPSATLEEAQADFESAQACACNSPDCQDVIEVVLMDRLGKVIRQSPTWI